MVFTNLKNNAKKMPYFYTHTPNFLIHIKKMSVLKKLKHLFQKSSKPAQTNPKKDKADELDHLNPISQVFSAWITQNEWTYQHFEPDERDDGTRLNVFVVNFGGGQFDWKLVVQILEKPQLISMFGIIDETVPKEYRLATAVLLAERARHLFFGDIELDLSTGDLRAKVYFDGEFTKLSSRMLDTQIGQLFRLTELCWEIKEQSRQMPTISDLSDLLTIAQDQRDELIASVNGESETKDENGQVFFAPSNARQ